MIGFCFSRMLPESGGRTPATIRNKVVLPAQTERMADALRKKDIPAEVYIFPEEGHGFRDANNKIKVFISRYLPELRYRHIIFAFFIGIFVSIIIFIISFYIKKK